MIRYTQMAGRWLTSLFLLSHPDKYIQRTPGARGGINPQATFRHPARRGVKKLGTKSCIVANRTLVLLALAEDITELLQRGTDELGVLPEVGGEETVGVDDGDEGSLEGVLEGLGGTGGGGVGILDTSKLEETLDGGGGNETSTTGGGNELYSITLAGFLTEVLC